MNETKGDLQDRLYSFPYHHIPAMDSGRVVRHRVLPWAFEYFSYLLEVRAATDELRPESILDVGCGEGNVLASLAGGTRRLLGIDTSEQAIQFARAFHPDIEFRVGRLEGLEETFDLVLAIEVLEHIPDEEIPGFLRSIHSRLGDRGRFLLTVPTVVLPLRPKHHRHYTRDLLENQFRGAGGLLEIERVEYLCASSRIYRLYNRLTANKHYHFACAGLDAVMWRYYSRRLRNATEARGQRMLVVARRR